MGFNSGFKGLNCQQYKWMEGEHRVIKMVAQYGELTNVLRTTVYRR